MTKIVFATGNQGKMREIKAIMADMDVEVVSMKEAGICVDIEEDGTTFEENALIKARSACEICGIPAIADDSGLCVDVLGGAPGIYSARYAGEHGNSKANNLKLLDALKDVEFEKRTGRFIRSVTLRAW